MSSNGRKNLPGFKTLNSLVSSINTQIGTVIEKNKTLTNEKKVLSNNLNSISKDNANLVSENNNLKSTLEYERNKLPPACPNPTCLPSRTITYSQIKGPFYKRFICPWLNCKIGLPQGFKGNIVIELSSKIGSYEHRFNFDIDEKGKPLISDAKKPQPPPQFLQSIKASPTSINFSVYVPDVILSITTDSSMIVDSIYMGV
jgi:hypothetical protein